MKAKTPPTLDDAPTPSGKKEISPEEKKVVQTTFYLTLPALMMASIAVFLAKDAIIPIVVILAFVLQFLLIKNFAETYFK